MWNCVWGWKPFVLWIYMFFLSLIFRKLQIHIIESQKLIELRMQSNIQVVIKKFIEENDNVITATFINLARRRVSHFQINIFSVWYFNFLWYLIFPIIPFLRSAYRADYTYMEYEITDFLGVFYWKLTNYSRLKHLLSCRKKD